MTPQIFNLDDEVKIVGPSMGGDTGCRGEIFEINMIRKDNSAGIIYTGKDVPWYPASSLELVNKAPLSPMWLVYNYETDDPVLTTVRVSCPCGRGAEIVLPEKNKSSEAPDELKIGDWVEVIGKPMPLYAECSDEIGRIFEITQEDTKNHEWFSCQCNPTYPLTSLRKLTPEEITKHLCHQRGEFASEERLDSLEGYARDNDARLSAIEKQLEEQQEKISQFNGEIGSIQECICREMQIEIRLAVFEKRQNYQQGKFKPCNEYLDRMTERCREIEHRLAFVEKFQRDQADLIGRGNSGCGSGNTGF